MLKTEKGAGIRYFAGKETGTFLCGQVLQNKLYGKFVSPQNSESCGSAGKLPRFPFMDIP